MLDEILAESSILIEREQQAEARGEAQGLFKGELVGLREAVQRALAARFGALDSKTEAAIANASREACLDVLAHLDETLEQVRARLEATPTADTTEPASGA